jgi:hypothetical protein
MSVLALASWALLKQTGLFLFIVTMPRSQDKYSFLESKWLKHCRQELILGCIDIAKYLIAKISESANAPYLPWHLGHCSNKQDCSYSQCQGAKISTIF